MARNVSGRRLTSEAPVRSQARTCEICGGQCGTGPSFSPSNSVFPCQDHSTNAPHVSSSQHYYQKDKRAKPENLHTVVIVWISESTEQWNTDTLFCLVEFSSTSRYRVAAMAIRRAPSNGMNPFQAGSWWNVHAFRRNCHKSACRKGVVSYSITLLRCAVSC
jgi:hypothetical protein